MRLVLTFIIKSLLKNERYLQSNLPFQHTSFHGFLAWRSMLSSHPHLSKGPKEVFLQLLKENDINAVDICGIDTDICVTKCAVDLFERDITPYVLKDYCATHADADIQESALIILARYIGKSQII